MNKQKNLNKNKKQAQGTETGDLLRNLCLELFLNLI